MDAPTVWNALPLPSLFQKAAKNLPVHQGIPTLDLLTPNVLCGAWPFFCPWILKLVDCFGFVAPLGQL